MTLYFIFKIDQTGEPKKKMHLRARTIKSAWMGARPWFSDGLYLVTNADGTEAETHKINRGGGGEE